MSGDSLTRERGHSAAGVSRAIPDPGLDFTTWVSDHQRQLLAFAALVAGDRDSAEDLVQIALARAFTRWPKLSRAGQYPEAYVRRIILNENASLWRRAWKHREHSTAVLPEAPATETEIDTTWSLVQGLPLRQRTAVALRFYADLSVTDTAALMGCSTGAVKTHTSRAMAKLKDALIATPGSGTDV